MKHYDWDDIWIHGLLGVFILLLVSLLSFGIAQEPKIAAMVFGGILGGIGFVFLLGWCICNWHNFLELLKFKKSSTPEGGQAPPHYIRYKNPVLDGLSRFEHKYGMSTVEFMSFVRSDFIPLEMNNLDYIEWISLANDLPSVTAEKSDA